MSGGNHFGYINWSIHPLFSMIPLKNTLMSTVCEAGMKK